MGRGSRSCIHTGRVLKALANSDSMGALSSERSENLPTMSCLVSSLVVMLSSLLARRSSEVMVAWFNSEI